ncbi:hypothetical protein [Pseudohoeflea coraliihabitans]|uniref:Uncharacterized protein n=1 Tax=Pseudohoeflea coraliihabitans TaxID=2860393 RepID=A0ABS6WSQ5_9HYPH|nr:hypothetical protein [Pseudohoeflea sp. DP4N28-3]MBW3098673.1 hypothetical protein [Pseudohoeflea sp. DP4N28-3]
MTTLTWTSLLLGAALSVSPIAASPALAAGDCAQAAARVVGQTGGQLLSATPTNRGGQTVCEITVLIPGTDKARPKKVTVSVPL